MFYFPEIEAAYIQFDIYTWPRIEKEHQRHIVLSGNCGVLKPGM